MHRSRCASFSCEQTTAPNATRLVILPQLVLPSLNMVFAMQLMKSIVSGWESRCIRCNIPGEEKIKHPSVNNWTQIRSYELENFGKLWCKVMFIALYDVYMIHKPKVIRIDTVINYNYINLSDSVGTTKMHKFVMPIWYLIPPAPPPFDWQHNRLWPLAALTKCRFQTISHLYAAHF